MMTRYLLKILEILLIPECTLVFLLGIDFLFSKRASKMDECRYRKRSLVQGVTICVNRWVKGKRMNVALCKGENVGMSL